MLRFVAVPTHASIHCKIGCWTEETHASVHCKIGSWPEETHASVHCKIGSWPEQRCVKKVVDLSTCRGTCDIILKGCLLGEVHVSVRKRLMARRGTCVSKEKVDGQKRHMCQ
jgi:hypothetical protein